MSSLIAKKNYKLIKCKIIYNSPRCSNKIEIKYISPNNFNGENILCNGIKRR